MRKRYRSVLVLFCLACCCTNNTWATPVTCTQDSATTLSCVYTYDPLDVALLSAAEGGTSTVSWSWSITTEKDQGWEFLNGTVKLSLADDDDTAAKKAGLAFDDLNQTNSNFNSNAWRKGFSVESSLLDDGLLTVTLTAAKGDFWFNGAQLIANYTLSPVVSPVMETAIPVPETGTILLLGTGILGLAGFLRRTKKV